DVLGGSNHGEFAAPGFGESGWIIYGEAVYDRLRVYNREALGQVQILIRTAEAVFSGEVGAVDDQRVAFPAAAGIAQPLAHRGGHMRSPIQQNPAHIMPEFDINGEEPRALGDL